MTLKLILAFVIAFLVSVGVGALLVPWLRKIKAGQSIREDGPTWHMSKSGTPTMGGLMFIAAAVLRRLPSSAAVTKTEMARSSLMAMGLLLPRLSALACQFIKSFNTVHHPVIFLDWAP